MTARKGLPSVCLLSAVPKSLYWMMGSDQSLLRRVHWSRLGRRRVTVTQSRPWTSSAVIGCWGAWVCCHCCGSVLVGPLPGVWCPGGGSVLGAGIAPAPLPGVWCQLSGSVLVRLPFACLGCFGFGVGGSVVLLTRLPTIFARDAACGIPGAKSCINWSKRLMMARSVSSD